jgi:hypothetical protein
MSETNESNERKEMRTFCVPVLYAVAGYIAVEATTPEEAVREAERRWDEAPYPDQIQDKAIGVEFASGGDWDEREEENHDEHRTGA